MFFSFSCNVGNSFLSFSHPIHEWSRFYRWFQFCCIASHDKILRICHFLRIDIIKSSWSITKCFSVPYGLRGSVEKNFFVIKSTLSYHSHSPRSLIRSHWSIVSRSLNFPLLRRPSTVVMQFWIICWREALHELLMVVMIRSFDQICFFTKSPWSILSSNWSPWILISVISLPRAQWSWRWNKHNKWFHSSRVKFPLVNMSAELVFGVDVFDLDFGVRINLDQTTNQVQLRKFWKHVSMSGFFPLMIILITASLSSKTYNKASWREDWTLEGTESIFSIGLLSEPWQPSRSQPPSRLFRSSETFSVIDMDPSAIWICLLPLLLFLCHTLPHIVRFVLLLLRRFLHNLQFVFSTRLLSACRLRSPLQSRLGVVSLSRQPSILVLLPCVDDFQYPCFSSSVQLLSSRPCTLRTSRPAVGTALCVLLIPPCCWVCSSACCWLCSSACCWLCSSACCSAEWDSCGSSARRRPCSSPLCSFSAIWRYLSSWLLYITRSSGCDAVSVLCLLASHPPALPCDSLLFRGSPHAPPTPLLSLRHFRDHWFAVGARAPITVAYNNVVCYVCEDWFLFRTSVHGLCPLLI